MNKIDSNTVTSNGDDLSKSAISQAFVSHAWSLLWTSMREVNRTTSVDGWPRVATTNSPFARTKSLCPLLIAYAFLCLLIPSWILRFELLCCELQPFHFASWVNALQSRGKRDQTWQRECTNENTWTTRLGRHVNAPDMQCVRLPAPHACLTQHVKSEVQKQDLHKNIPLANQKKGWSCATLWHETAYAQHYCYKMRSRLLQSRIHGKKLNWRLEILWWTWIKCYKMLIGKSGWLSKSDFIKCWFHFLHIFSIRSMWRKISSGNCRKGCKVQFINVFFVKMCATPKNAWKKKRKGLFAGEGVGGGMPVTEDTKYCTCHDYR